MQVLTIFLKVIVVVMIIFAVASYSAYLNTGRFWLPNISFSDIKLSMPFSAKPPEMQSLEAPNEVVYKWRENGKWLYGKEPPDISKAQRVGDKK